MNRFLLLAAALLVASAANAQVKRSETVQAPLRPTLQLMQHEVKIEEMQMRTPEAPAVKAPNRDGDVKVWYRRPAGAFTSSVVVEDGAYAGFLYAPYLAVKPYSYYTFLGFAEGVSENAQYYWDVQYWDETGTDGAVQKWATIEGKNLTWRWMNEVDEVPTFYVLDNGEYYSWYLHGYEKSTEYPTVMNEHKAKLLSVPSTMDLWNYDILKSSKTFSFSNKDSQGQFYPMIAYSGPDPYGQNTKGWWFGKNGGKNNYRYDGIAQAYEKPEHPYLLKQVVMDCSVLEVSAQVDMYCKIYKIDRIPPYKDEGTVTLPEVPGELICKGRATVTPETYYETGGLVFFNLYGEDDGLEYDYTPTIDDAILVVVDGYNDPEMENLVNFSAMIASNYDQDEGFGELAYLKVGVPDEEGNLDHYEWTGLNNFFTTGTMMTGITIFLSTELPYLTFYYDDENGEYIFPGKGGSTEDSIGIDFPPRGIVFWSWVPSADDQWEVSCNGDEVPDWLTIELEDQIEQGEFSGKVKAKVTAEPMPIGLKYREAIVRFEYPGAYINYKFMQGKNGPYPATDFDINEDGEVNIADVNALISLIVEDEIDIIYLIALIDYILGNPHIPMPW